MEVRESKIIEEITPNPIDPVETVAVEEEVEAIPEAIGLPPSLPVPEPPKPKKKAKVVKAKKSRKSTKKKRSSKDGGKQGPPMMMFQPLPPKKSIRSLLHKDEPKEEPKPVRYYCAVNDPDGNFVEFSYGQPLGQNF